MSDFSALKELIFDESSVFFKGILSNPNKNAEFQKIKITPVKVKGDFCFHVEQFTEKQAFQKNLSKSELFSFLEEKISKEYKQAVFETSTETLSFLTNKKGKMSVIKKQVSKNACAPCNNQPKEQNRQKKYILNEGKPVPFLVELGVMTKDGAVISQKYDKFRQINRFLEYIDDVLESVLTLPDGKQKDELSVVDFGCGKSYLTFAVYHYLTNIKGIKTKIIGLDLKKDVIDHCNELASKLKYETLKFQTGDIAHFEENKNFDMMITLHACDTATDYALARAVNWNIPVILSVPCCQHELNANLSKKEVSSEIVLFLKYGIIKERFASLATDAMRAELLESSGYAVQLLEFIDMSHTPKNILIRAIKKTENSKQNEKTEGFLNLKRALGTSPLLENLL